MPDIQINIISTQQDKCNASVFFYFRDAKRKNVFDVYGNERTAKIPSGERLDSVVAIFENSTNIYYIELPKDELKYILNSNTINIFIDSSNIKFESINPANEKFTHRSIYSKTSCKKSVNDDCKKLMEQILQTWKGYNKIYKERIKNNGCSESFSFDNQKQNNYYYIIILVIAILLNIFIYFYKVSKFLFIILNIFILVISFILVIKNI